MTLKDWLAALNWRFKRLKCFFLGCDEQTWSENEWINGVDCKRCDAGYDNVYNETPWKLFEGNLIARLFPRFWMDHFE